MRPPATLQTTRPPPAGTLDRRPSPLGGTRHPAATPDREEIQRRERVLRVDRTLAAALISFSLLFLGVLGAFRLGAFDPSRRLTVIPWELTLILLAFLSTAGMASIAARRFPPREGLAFGPDTGFRIEGRRDPARLFEFSIVSGGVTLGLGLGIAALLTYLHGTAPLGPSSTLLLTTLAIISNLAPLGWFEHRRMRHVRQVEERFPSFLRDFAEAYRSHQSMALAIRSVADNEYGELTRDVKRMAQQVSWGIPFPVALRRFGREVGTPLIERSASLIEKALEAGGDVSAILNVAARDAREIKTIERERRVTMGIYVLVVYVAFAVFLAVVAVLQGLFVPAMLAATQGATAAGGFGGLRTSPVSELDFRFIYYCAGFVQALGSGFVAGVLSEGTFAAGVKHASILIGLTLLVLGILL